MEAAQAYEQQYQALTQVRDGLLDEAAAAREQVAAFGLSRSEVELLSIAKVRSAAAALEHKAILREERADLDPIAGLYRDQAAALREIAKARGELVDKERAYDAGAEIRALNDALAGDFANAFTGFLDGSLSAKDAFKSFANSVVADLARIAARKAAMSLFGDSNGQGGVDWAKLISTGIGLFSGGGGGGASPYVYPGSYATGMSSAPRDGMAYLHKGEAVVPKQYNPAAGGKGLGAAPTVINNFTVNGQANRETQMQIASAAYSGAQRAFARNG